MKVRFLSLVTLVAVIAAATSPIAAQNVVLSGTGFGPGTPTYHGFAFSFSFVLPQSPVPILVGSNYFRVASVSGSETQGNQTTNLGVDTLHFFNGGLGGFQFTGPSGGPFGFFGDLVNGSGPMFTGNTAHPTFLPGSYSFQDESIAYGGVVTSATISAATTVSTTPEPSTVALLATGLAGIVPMIRRKRV